jgi:enoyl-CoA hydratase
MSKGLAVEQRDGVTLLRMQFGRANALGPEVVDVLSTAISELDGAPAVLTGEGRTFSAGLDLLSLHELDRPDFEAFVERFTVLLVQVLAARGPMIAAINGHAVAGGCIMALACDKRVGTAGDFKIGMNELAIGVTLPAAGLEIPRGALSPAALRRVALDAELMDPQRALDIGVLDELAPDAETAVDRACQQARSLGHYGHVYSVVKGSIVGPVAHRIKEHRPGYDLRFVESWFSEEATKAREAALARLKK